MFAVVASNIHWHWTPNGYLAGGIGALLAWIATRLIYGALTWRQDRCGLVRPRPTLDNPATDSLSYHRVAHYKGVAIADLIKKIGIAQV